MLDRFYWPTTIASLFLAFCSYLSIRLQLADFRLSFLLMILGLLVASLTALAALARVLKLKARHERVDPKVVLAAMVGVLPGLMVIASIGRSGIGKPLIHDITTDTVNPPTFVLAPEERKEGENSLVYAGTDIADLQKVAYPSIKTLRLEASAEDVAGAIRGYISQQGWRLLSGSAARDNHIEAVATTRIMGFRDDVVFRLMPVKDGVLVDIRSASRVGTGDLGVNAKRIENALIFLRNQFPVKPRVSIQEGA